MSADRQATDGAWDSTRRPVFFLAGGHNLLDVDISPAPLGLLIAVNDFAQPGSTVNAAGWDLLDRIIDTGRPVFLDSGIFWMTNQHKRAHDITMDEALSLPPDEIDGFDWLWDTYLDVADRLRDRIWGYNELDQGGMACKVETRSKLEALGFHPIPVYHPLNDGWSYFDDLAEGYDRICWGNVVQAAPYVRQRMIATLAERHRAHPDLWVHLLGLTPNEVLAGMPFDSCDSSAWTYTFRQPRMNRDQSLGRRLMGQRAGDEWPCGFDRKFWPVSVDGDTRRLLSQFTVGIDGAMLLGLTAWRDRLVDEVGWEPYPARRDEEPVPCPAA